MNPDARSYMNANQGNVTDAAMAAAMAPPFEEDMSESGSEAATDPSFERYNGGGQAAPESVSASEVSSVRSSIRSRRRNGAPKKSAYDTAAEKSELLYKIDRLKKRGCVPMRTVTFDDDLDDIRLEFDRMTKAMNVEKSIKFQQSLLISFASGAEFLNSTFDPVGIKLDGWSDSVNEKITDYDEVLEELAEKYGSGSSNLPPELKLIFMIMTSGAMFHLSSTMFKSAGIDEVMKENPDLAKDVAAAMARSAEKKSRAENNPAMGGMAGMMGNLFKPGNSRPMERPDTTEIDEMLNEDIFSESDESEPDSLLDDVDEDSRKVVMDI